MAGEIKSSVSFEEPKEASSSSSSLDASKESRRASEILGGMQRKKLHNRERSNFTLKRGAHRREENLFLSEQFAAWLSDTTKVDVKSRDEFCDSLADGVALCSLMKQLEGSGMKSYHGFPVKNEFKRRENIVRFQESCKRLELPFVCRVDHIIKGTIDPVISCLLGVARVAAEQEGFVLPEPIMEKLEAMEALETQEHSAKSDAVLSYAEAHGIQVVELGIDGWVQRTPSSWIQLSWMDFGIRVNETTLADRDEGKKRASSTDNDDVQIDETGAWDVYRRYSEFERFYKELSQLVPSVAAASLPGKTFTFHLTGQYVEGGVGALKDRMDGLNAFLEIVCGEQKGAQEDKLGYTACVRRAHESPDAPSEHDLKVIGLVRKFIGAEIGW